MPPLLIIIGENTSHYGEPRPLRTAARRGRKPRTKPPGADRGNARENARIIADVARCVARRGAGADAPRASRGRRQAERARNHGGDLPETMTGGCPGAHRYNGEGEYSFPPGRQFKQGAGLRPSGEEWHGAPRRGRLRTKAAARRAEAGEAPPGPAHRIL